MKPIRTDVLTRIYTNVVSLVCLNSVNTHVQHTALNLTIWTP